MAEESPAPTLVLLPGMDGTGVLFRPLVAALPASVATRVIAYPPDPCLSLAGHARHVRSQLPEGEVVLLAESFSGLVALTLLAESEPRVKGVLFVSSFAEPPRAFLPWLASLLPSFSAFGKRAPDSFLRHCCLGPRAGADKLGLLREALEAVSPAVLDHRFALLRTPHRFELAPSPIPCFCLRGSRDRLISRRSARALRRYFRHCEEQVLDGPHFLLQTRPDRCAAWIEDKLERLA